MMCVALGGYTQNCVFEFSQSFENIVFENVVSFPRMPESIGCKFGNSSIHARAEMTEKRRKSGHTILSRCLAGWLPTEPAPSAGR